jgi:hypothetical protein
LSIFEINVSIDATAPRQAGQPRLAAARPRLRLRSITNPAERAVFGLVIVLAIALAVALPFSGYSIVWASMLPTLGAALALIAVAVIYRTVRPSPRIAAMCMGTAALLLFSMLTALLNYFAVRLGRPLIDATLAGWDRALGIDWPGLVAAMQAMPWVKLTLSLAYVTTLPQIAIVVVILALSGRLERLSHFMLAFCLAALLTVAFWAIFPSFGAFAHYWQADPSLSDRGLIVDAPYARELLALRSGTIDTLSIDELTGLIAFPSFHTAIAVLAAYYLWPVRFAGIAALILNILVVLSVPIDGGHHVVDVPAGILTALAGVVLASLWLRGAPDSSENQPESSGRSYPDR